MRKNSKETKSQNLNELKNDDKKCFIKPMNKSIRKYLTKERELQQSDK